MTENKNNSLISIGSTGLVRVGNSIEITNKIIKELEGRSITELFKWVKIGNQEWMTKNLDVDCYANGDPIPLKFKIQMNGKDLKQVLGATIITTYPTGKNMVNYTIGMQ